MTADSAETEPLSDLWPSRCPRPRLLPSGDTALTVEFGDTVDPELNACVMALDRALGATAIDGVGETVPTYRSLLIQYDPVVIDHDTLSSHVLSLCRGLAPAESAGRWWRIPVVYGGTFGIDLDPVAAHHGLTPAQVIERHAAALYRVVMIGFVPGFAYLDGLDPVLATPRLATPRHKVPAGTIMIGGVQAGIASIDMPSGWHLLGRTPVRSYQLGRDPVFLLSPGDRVTFTPVGEERWTELDAAAAVGAPVAELLGEEEVPAG